MNDKEKKLLERPVESDTKILVKKLVNFGEFQALYEKWVWDGISASSIVCLEEDVASMSKEDLIKFIFEKMQLPVDKQTTHSVSGGYVFVNFGFDAG